MSQLTSFPFATVILKIALFVRVPALSAPFLVQLRLQDSQFLEPILGLVPGRGLGLKAVLRSRSRPFRAGAGAAPKGRLRIHLLINEQNVSTIEYKSTFFIKYNTFFRKYY